MEYRRLKILGGTYFFTVVTHARRPFLCEPENIELLRAAFRYAMTRSPFELVASVILPDHLHCIWTLPENDADFSTRWRLVKTFFSRHCAEKYQVTPSSSRQGKKRWQFGNAAFGSIGFVMSSILLVTLTIFTIIQ